MRGDSIAPTTAPDVADPPQAAPQTRHPAFPRGLRQVQVLTLIAVALALVPSGAHFSEMFSKMSLDAETYMAVQNIYRGWALFGFVVLSALLLTMLHAVMVRADRAAMIWALAAFAAIAGTQVIFWTWTYPANAITENWTVTPENFEAVRAQWEYSHAASAALNLFGVAATSIAVVVSAQARSPQG